MERKWMALFVFILALFCNPVCSQFDQDENEIDENLENEGDDTFYVDAAAVDDNDDDSVDDDNDYDNNAVDDDDGDDESDNKDTKGFKKWLLNCVKTFCQKDKSLCSICKKKTYRKVYNDKVKETKRSMRRRRSYQRRRRCKNSPLFGSFCRRRSGR